MWSGLFTSAYCLTDKAPEQHVPVHEYLENLKELTQLLASAGVSADRVIFITPPPVDEQAWEKECILKGITYLHLLLYLHAGRFVFWGQEGFLFSSPGSTLNRLNSVAGQYAQACVQAATQCCTDVLDLWTLMQKDGQVGSADTM